MLHSILLVISHGIKRKKNTKSIPKMDLVFYELIFDVYFLMILNVALDPSVPVTTITYIPFWRSLPIIVL